MNEIRVIRRYASVHINVSVNIKNKKKMIKNRMILLEEKNPKKIYI